MSDKQATQIAPGLTLVFDPAQWTLENALSVSGLGEDVLVSFHLHIQDLQAETSQRVEGIAILRNT